MSSAESTENTRRLLLRVTAKLMVAFAVIVGLWVIFSPLFKPNVPVNAKPVDTVFNVARFTPDTVDIVEWFDKPLIIARRSAQSQNNLAGVEPADLRDPVNERSVQPDAADNPLRSESMEWFVAIGLGTSSGCALTFRREALQNGETAVFVDGCDGSRYDLAGRALAGSAARKNLPVPHWRLDGERLMVSTETVQ
ncbi:MAG: hypothetical protein AAF404_01160 [Pseudomonadota bacterium]